MFRSKAVISSTIVTTLLAILIFNVPHTQLIQTGQTDPVTLEVYTNNTICYIRDLVHIYGSLKYDGSPLSELVAIEIRDPSSLPLLFRTLPTGEIQSNSWPLDFIELYLCDSSGQKKDVFTVNEIVWIKFSIKNYDSISHKVFVTFTLFDANMVPIWVRIPLAGSTINPGETKTVLFMTTYIPGWAHPGNATIFANIFSDFPMNGGVAYCPEKAISFEIKRNPQIKYSQLPSFPSSDFMGSYITAFRLSPESKPGNYVIYVSTSSKGTLVKNTTDFSVEETTSPPQASFTYTPLKPYVNMSITFDASSSTAEGYNDTIVSYEWDFGDGSGKQITTSPKIEHVFTQSNIYLVTLNVTDSEGLWCVTSKPVKIYPPEGPVAEFIWYPSIPLVNQTVTFDATVSSPGWNGTAHPPIVSYEWDFGDGNVTSGFYPTITHVYTVEGNYTVRLTITDSEGLQSNQTHIVTVSKSTLVGDINGDGYVNARDAVLLGVAFGSQPGDPNWDPRADLNGDNWVNAKDAVILGVNFGKSIYG